MGEKIKIDGYEITNDFIREYEEYMESIRDFEYGELYKIEVILSDAGVNAGIMEIIERAREMELGFFIHDERRVAFITEITHTDEGIHEIEITMDHTLNGDKYGVYTWRCLRT